MVLSKLSNEIGKMDSHWHKLLFLCHTEVEARQIHNLSKNIEILNLNLLLSKSLLEIPKAKYPMYVEEFVRALIPDPSKVYVLEHIDILFDPALQIHPIRLLENISKQMKLMVIWPGVYENGKLSYAESGHPEYFTCGDFEGKVILN